jgi:hypothetical protein
MTEKTGSIKAHCRACGPYRTHTILKHVEKGWDDEGAGASGADEYFLIQCGGCEAITLKHDAWNTWDTEDDGSPEVSVTYYPPAISRKEPEWLNSPFGPFYFDSENAIVKLLKEIYSALHNNSQALAAMGIRALIEHIMIDKIGDKGSISANVRSFIESGYIGSTYAPLFQEQLIEYGHAAMHRGHFPKPSDIATLLDITEGLIATIYVHPHQAKGLKAPPARRRATPN